MFRRCAEARFMYINVQCTRITGRLISPRPNLSTIGRLFRQFPVLRSCSHRNKVPLWATQMVSQSLVGRELNNRPVQCVLGCGTALVRLVVVLGCAMGAAPLSFEYFHLNTADRRRRRRVDVVDIAVVAPHIVVVVMAVSPWCMPCGIATPRESHAIPGHHQNI